MYKTINQYLPKFICELNSTKCLDNTSSKQLLCKTLTLIVADAGVVSFCTFVQAKQNAKRQIM